MATAIKQLEPLSQEEAEKVHQPTDQWSDSFALETVKRDFSYAENYLQQNHYVRWLNADRTYLAWTQQKYWEGTKVPRATPAVWLAFEQIESLLPRYLGTIFGADPFAEAEPLPGTSMESARISRDFILSQFADAKGRKAVRQAVKSALIYGNGIIEAGWKSFTRKRNHYMREFRPEMKMMQGPMGMKMRIPTGGFRSIVHETTVEETINRPFANYISLKDFYIDPNCPTTDVQDARYAAKRCYMAVDELDAMRDDEDFNIPSLSALHEMSEQKRIAQADAQKTASAAYRGEMFQPSIDKTSDPAGKTVEVINYWTKDRCVWVLNRDWVAYNDANEYRDNLGDPIIPFFNVYYTDVLDRFYALALTDITEWDQRVIVSLLGGRLDELALNLNPPRVKRRGVSIPAYQMRRRPGATVEFDTPKDDLVQEPVSNVTGQAFVEVQAAEQRSYKATGNGEVNQGAIPAQGNAAARTATGASGQAGAAGGRVIYAVENAEAEFVEPILNFFAGMNRDYLDPNQMIQFTGPDNKPQMADPLHVKNAVVGFKMKAGSRARAKAALQQVMPLMMQTFLNPEFLQLVGQQQNKTVDTQGIEYMIEDMAGWKPRGAFFRDMTPQEQQAMQPKPPLPDPQKQQLQDARLQSAAANQDAKGNVEILKALISANRQARSAERSINSESGFGGL